MPIMIDGHNLVPKIPGLDLNEIDDEIQLVNLLLEYCRIKRKQLIVYFDKAPVGHPRLQKYGLVTAFFARPGKTADDEIKGKLVRLGASARNWTVVSSDASIQTAVRAARATVVSSEDFARELISSLKVDPAVEKSRQEPTLDEGEIEMWLNLFEGEQTNEEGKSGN